MQQPKQGSIYWADLNPIRGHEQGGFRPVLIIQNDILSEHLNTVIIIPITKNLSTKGYLTTYYLPQQLSNLKFPSIALIYQLRAIDKTRLVKLITCLPTKIVKLIKEQMNFIF